MDKTKIMDFFISLQEFSYKESGRNVHLFRNVYKIPVEINKGNVSNVRRITIEMIPSDSNLPLNAFTEMDNLCKKYECDCIYGEGKFTIEFTTTI